MKRRMIGILLSMTLAVGMLTGCGGSDNSTASANGTESTNAAPTEAPTTAGAESETPPQEKEGGYTFGYTAKDGSNPFFIAVENAIREAVEANGDKLIATDPSDDVDKQISQIEDMIVQGIDAIFLNPAEAEGILPALDKLKEAGIPIINFDTEVADMSYITAYVGSDNYNAGFVCGEDLVKRSPEGGKVIVLDEPTANSVVDRVNGFLAALEDKGFEVVSQQNGKGNLETAMSVCEDLLQANSDVVCLFGGNDPMALGALAAANAANITECYIYGVDGSPDVKAELTNEGTLLTGTGAQSPNQIGITSAEVMYKIMNGENVDERYPVETFLINADNVGEFGTDGWQ